MRYADRLRPPRTRDETAATYKDWLHLNFFDPATDVAAILNASLHGDPRASEAVASATALVRVGGEWFFDTKVVPQSAAAVSDGEIRFMSGLAIRLDPVTNGVSASYRSDIVDLDVDAKPLVDPIVVDHVPFGSGWIGWHAVPVLRLTGTIDIKAGAGEAGDDVTTTIVGGALAYHDHNWGRWAWGDNIGWEWATLLGEEASIVFSKATDRSHRAGSPNVTVALPGERRWQARSYSGPTVTASYSRWGDLVPTRIPGAMAALHTGRMMPRIPAALDLTIDDGFDRINVRFDADDAAQVITADPLVAGYSFIHELVGTFTASGTSGGRPFSASGDGVLEYVD